MCILWGDGVRPQWLEGVPYEVCARFHRCLQAFVGDLSLYPQPAGWALSRVPLFLRAKAADRLDQLRPVGVVPTTKRAASSLLAARDRITTTQINALAYRKGAGLDRVPRKAVEWGDDLVLVAIVVEQLPIKPL